MQTVIVDDLVYGGWSCEGIGCHALFQPGDLAFGAAVGMTSDGTPIEGEFRCLTCWTNDVEVL